MESLTKSIQKRTGLVILLFTAAVFLAQLSFRVSKGLPLFRLLDIVPLLSFLFSVLCLRVENKWTRRGQVFLLVAVGFEILSSNMYFAACVMCIAFVLAYSYGLFSTWRWTKFFLVAPSGYCVFLMASPDPIGLRLVNATFFIILIYSFILIVYFIFLDMFKKCRAYEEHLKESVEEEKARAIAEAVSEYRKNLSLLVEASERLLLIVDKRRERNHE